MNTASSQANSVNATASPRSSRRSAFTIIELLVATAVLLLLMVLLVSATESIGSIWRSSSGKISAFQNARAAFSTISRTLQRATLNTYNDYTDESKAYRNNSNAKTFVPKQFSRASELHFLSGPAAEIVPGGSALRTPGDAIFFQSTMGQTEDDTLSSMNRMLNSTGFYVEYGNPDSRMIPTWLDSAIGTNKSFRLLQFVQPTEDLEIYTSTASPAYSLNWLLPFATPQNGTYPRARVLAENVPLLVMLPRLAPEDEETVADNLGTGYDPATNPEVLGTILSPNYHYDSRAWQTGYPGAERVAATATASERAEIMRNQVPPIVELVMVAVDPQSIARFDRSGDDPPVELQIPENAFTDASKLSEDLSTYSTQLSQAGIRFRIFRTSIEIKGAKWSNN